MVLFGSNIYIQLFLLHVKITILKGVFRTQWNI